MLASSFAFGIANRRTRLIDRGRLATRDRSFVAAGTVLVGVFPSSAYELARQSFAALG